MPTYSPRTLAHVSPSYLQRNVGFAIWIQPDAHLAQHPSLEGGEHQRLWPAGTIPAADGQESTARFGGGGMGRGAGDWVTLRSKRIGVPSLSIGRRNCGCLCFTWRCLGGSRQCWVRWGDQGWVEKRLFLSAVSLLPIRFMGRIHPIVLLRYEKNKSS